MSALDSVLVLLKSFFTQNLFGTLVTAAFGAFAGAWASSRRETKRAIIAELNSINAARAVCFSICNIVIALKRQHIRELKSKYEKERLQFIAANLAWMFVHERGLENTIPRNHVGLRKSNVRVRAALSKEFQARLDEMEAWFGYVTEYRDALSHRIPLYIPPGAILKPTLVQYNELTTKMTAALNSFQPHEYQRLSVEQTKLLVFQPMITHSVRETTGHFPFHIQMLADFLTVEELWNKMRIELGKA